MCDGFFNPNFPCPLCNRFHAIRQCTRFMCMTVEQKLRVVAHHSLCSNCLAHTHRRSKCRSIDRCKRCRQDHNTWLHPMMEGKIWVQMTATIVIRTRPEDPDQWTRVLIDPNAARSSIMFDEAEALWCDIRNGRTKITICNSRRDGRKIDLVCAVENKVYGCSPVADVDRTQIESAPSETVANRKWFKSMHYYMILGADVANHIFTGPAKGLPGRLYAQETIFGITYFGEAYPEAECLN